jgi:hypothetical protein
MCMTEEVLLETVKSLEHVQLRCYFGEYSSSDSDYCITAQPFLSSHVLM